MATQRFRLEVSFSREEERLIKEYCLKYGISYYALGRTAILGMIKKSKNNSLKEYY